MRHLIKGTFYKWVVANCDQLLKSKNSRWSQIATSSKKDTYLENKAISIVPNEVIMNKILLIRNQKVMIARDLAELFGITTKRLNE